MVAELKLVFHTLTTNSPDIITIILGYWVTKFCAM